MTTTISKRFTFDAAHFLPTVPVHHKCRGMHGHTYAVELRFRGATDARGFCAGIDYGDIATVWERLHRLLDHKVLNEVAGLEVPSTEILVVWIAERFVEMCGREHAKLRNHLSSVLVRESETTWCEYVVSQAWRRNARRDQPTPPPRRSGKRGEE